MKRKEKENEQKTQRQHTESIKNILHAGGHAAFEGWAAALYVHYLKGRGQICLDIRPEDVPPQEETLYTKTCESFSELPVS